MGLLDFLHNNKKKKLLPSTNFQVINVFLMTV